MPSSEENRRPIQARSAAWAQGMAQWLARSNISPNQISVASIFFAALGAAALLIFPNAMGMILCAIGIQARLVCNLLDGMVAIEGGKKSSVGQIYNEFPDRIADSILIVALGYASDVPWLGWFGALAAALTAYVRVFGGSVGFAQDFRGPMAKQHRMAVMTIACVIAAIEWYFLDSRYALTAAAWLIAIGSVVTCVTRTLSITRSLKG